MQGLGGAEHRAWAGQSTGAGQGRAQGLAGSELWGWTGQNAGPGQGRAQGLGMAERRVCLTLASKPGHALGGPIHCVDLDEELAVGRRLPWAGSLQGQRVLIDLPSVQRHTGAQRDLTETPALSRL